MSVSFNTAFDKLAPIPVTDRLIFKKKNEKLREILFVRAIQESLIGTSVSSSALDSLLLLLKVLSQVTVQ